AVLEEALRSQGLLLEIADAHNGPLALAGSFARLGRKEQALMVIRAMTNPGSRAKALAGLVEFSPDAWSAEVNVLMSEATALDWTVRDNRRRAEALNAVASALLSAGDREQLLRLVQDTWRRAETRSLLLQTASVARGLIAVRPEIGIALADAFAW